MNCRPGPSPESHGTGSAERLAGQYRIKLVATSGVNPNSAAEGTLRLQPYDSTMRVVTIRGITDTSASYVLYGSTDVDLTKIDAVRTGELESIDPKQPGVLVIERKGNITLRLGSEANRRDLARYDGGYTALRVSHISDGEFTGTWSSGVTAPRSSGYFCAWREG